MAGIIDAVGEIASRAIGKECLTYAGVTTLSVIVGVPTAVQRLAVAAGLQAPAAGYVTTFGTALVACGVAHYLLRGVPSLERARKNYHQTGPGPATGDQYRHRQRR